MKGEQNVPPFTASFLQVTTTARAEPIPNPGAKNFSGTSHAGTGSHGFGPSLPAFPGHKQGAGREVEQLGYNPSPI